jgi:hypothetical protein
MQARIKTFFMNILHPLQFAAAIKSCSRIECRKREPERISRRPQQNLQSSALMLDSFARGPAMRRTIVFSLFALLAVSAANDACAQRRDGMGHGFGRGGYGFSRARAMSPYGFGYPYQPYDSGAEYPYAPQPAYFVQPPLPLVLVQPQPPAPPVVAPPVHPVITEYKWPAAGAASSPSARSRTSDSEPQAFAIVLKNGSTLSAVSVFSSDDGLHYVDPDERHLRISMSEVDRAATLKLNRARNLDLYLPAPQ